MTDDDQTLERCARCEGVGKDPETDGKCELCLGEQTIPAIMNRQYNAANE